MKQSLGLVEIEGLACAVVVADAMVKSANVELLGVETARGMGYMTIKVAGDVGAVNAAVEAGCQLGRMDGKLVSWKVIPRPSDSVEQAFCRPAVQEPAEAAKEEKPAAEAVQEAPAAEEGKPQEKAEEKPEAKPEIKAEAEVKPEAKAEEKPAAAAPRKKDKHKKKNTDSRS